MARVAGAWAKARARHRTPDEDRCRCSVDSGRPRGGVVQTGNPIGPTMSKHLLKRHKRQVARAKLRIQVSEPDVRTQEEIKAAREASRPADGSDRRPMQHPGQTRNHGPSTARGAAKTDT